MFEILGHLPYSYISEKRYVIQTHAYWILNKYLQMWFCSDMKKNTNPFWCKNK